MSKEKLIIITGPSGSGKTTITNYLQSKYDVNVLGCTTTREKRIDDDENFYTYLTKQEFDSLEKNGKFFFVTGKDKKYGFLKSDLQEKKYNIISTSYENAIRLIDMYEDCIVIQLVFSNMNSLIYRCGTRLKDDELDIRVAYSIYDFINNYYCIRKYIEENNKGISLYTDLYKEDEIKEIISYYVSEEIEPLKEKVKRVE